MLWKVRVPSTNPNRGEARPATWSLLCAQITCSSIWQAVNRAWSPLGAPCASCTLLCNCTFHSAHCKPAQMSGWGELTTRHIPCSANSSGEVKPLLSTLHTELMRPGFHETAWGQGWSGFHWPLFTSFWTLSLCSSLLFEIKRFSPRKVFSDALH